MPAPFRNAGRRTAFAVRLSVVIALVASGLAWGHARSRAHFKGQRLSAGGVARPSPVDAPRVGQDLYVDSVQANETIDGDTGCTVLVRERRQIWIGADGAGRLLEKYGRGTFLSASGRKLCQRTHSNEPTNGGTSDGWFASRCLELGLASRLTGDFPDPTILLREMRRIDGGPTGPAEDFVHVGDFLRESDDSPALRFALYRAAERIPDVKLLHSVTDHLGRHGSAVSLNSHGTTSELIFNQHNGAFLGEQTAIAATGQLTGWAAYRTTAIVDRIPGTPPQRLDPPCQPGGAGYVHTTHSGVTVTTGAPPKRRSGASRQNA